VRRLLRRARPKPQSACRLVGIDHSVLRYQSRQPDDRPLRQQLHQLAAVRRRFGYRRLSWLLRREGYRLNHKRLYRLYREQRLMVHRRGGRKRAASRRTPLLQPQRINQRWSLIVSATRSVMAAAFGSCAWSKTTVGNA
jgi:putative transposase